jgi:predicted RNA-binding Zn ribbon-like protein
MDRVQEQQIKIAEESEQSATPFLFRAGELALDLVNTEVMVRGKRGDLLATPQDIDLWWQAACQHHAERDEVRGAEGKGSPDDNDFLDEIKILRAALRDIFLTLIAGAAPQEASVAVLNEVLKMGYHCLEWTSTGEPHALYQTSAGERGTVLLPIALSALRLLQQGDHKRLHQCDNERCILLFYDSTKSATRRWCSLGCLDRARSAQRYKAKKLRT